MAYLQLALAYKIVALESNQWNSCLPKGPRVPGFNINKVNILPCRAKPDALANTLWRFHEGRKWLFLATPSIKGGWSNVQLLLEHCKHQTATFLLMHCCHENCKISGSILVSSYCLWTFTLQSMLSIEISNQVKSEKDSNVEPWIPWKTLHVTALHFSS